MMQRSSAKFCLAMFVSFALLVTSQATGNQILQYLGLAEPKVVEVPLVHLYIR